MSDELERKRQEKVANFKIHFGDETEDNQELSSSAVKAPPAAGNGPSMPPEPANSSFRQRIEEPPEEEADDLNSYSSVPDPDTGVIDPKSLRKAKRTDRKRRRRKAKKNRAIFRIVWLAMIVFSAIMIGQFLMVGVNDLLAVGREEKKAVTITIPKDANIDEITDILYDNHVINNKMFFKLFASVTKSTTGFTQGTFEIDTNKDYEAIINYMQSDMNRTDVVTLRFTEGMTLRQYAKILEEGGVCESKAFLAMCNSNEFDENYEFIKSIPNASKREYKLEGYLFPDTYDFYVGEDVDVVIKKFLANYRRKMYSTKSRADGFEKRVTIEQRAKKLGMSMEDLLTLASLIQAEAADQEDMYKVSSVLHNRLATLETNGVNENDESGLDYLQLDSTVFYPYASQRDVPAAQKKTFSGKYNTYKLRGLPPGPICNPGMDAIEAALCPEETEYYYFCHKPAKGTDPAVSYYAETMEEHSENLKKAGLA